MLTPNDPKIQENLPKIKEIIMKDSVLLYFLPSTGLKEMVSRAEHVFVKGMPLARKMEILSGEGIAVQKEMVWKWLNGKLDKKNAFILSHGEIRVLDKNSLSHGDLINPKKDK